MVLRRLLGLAVLLVVTACETGQSLKPVPTRPEGFAPWTDQVPAYRVGFGDELDVRFILTPDFDDSVVVSPDGTINLRTAGRVQAEGRTLPELEQAIYSASSRVLHQPMVTVSVAKPASYRIYVGGSVRAPGVFLLSGPIGPLEAVLMAGGFNEEARFEEVVLIRRSPEGGPMLRTVDLRQFINTGRAAGDVPLTGGDILYVPRSSIAELNLWVQLFIERVVPFQRSFIYTVGTSTSGIFGVD